MIYEVMYILPSKYSDSEIEGVNTIVAGLFSKHGAKIEKTDNLGKVKFAYPIKKVTHGTYMLTFIEAEGESLANIDKELKLSDEVLRHIIVKREKGIPTSVFPLTSYIAPLTSEGKRANVKPVVKDRPKPQTKVDGKKLSTAELDKKLDDILESDIVSDV